MAVWVGCGLGRDRGEEGYMWRVRWKEGLEGVSIVFAKKGWGLKEVNPVENRESVPPLP